MKKIYYNEIDPFCVSWLKKLIDAKMIPDGDIDERSIEDVTPAEIKEYTQCHFFAGLGGYPYALKLAGWSEDRPVWTGSCPCQPFSQAGQGKGFADERHLWPAWFHLISNVRPVVIFGEQVAKAVEWLDLVRDDLEGIDYSFGAVDLPACSVGAYHKRQRLWFVGEDTKSKRRRGWSNGNQERRNGQIQIEGLCSHRLANPVEQRQEEDITEKGQVARLGSGSGDLGDSKSKRLQKPTKQKRRNHPAGTGETDPVADPDLCGHETSKGQGGYRKEQKERRMLESEGTCPRGLGDPDGTGLQQGGETTETSRLGDSVDTAGCWNNARWHRCQDGKYRPIPLESRFQFMVNGLSDGVVYNWDKYKEVFWQEVETYADINRESIDIVQDKLWHAIKSQIINNKCHEISYLFAHAMMISVLLEHDQNKKDLAEDLIDKIDFLTGKYLEDYWENFYRKDFDANSHKLCNDYELYNHLMIFSLEYACDKKTISVVQSLLRFPLSLKFDNHAHLLRGAGNSILPQLASEVIKVYMDYCCE